MREQGEWPNIKIYVSCHEEFYVPQNKYLFPIQVGAKLSDKRFPGFLHDDVGDNISEKNKSFCELTAQYWAWKNEEADYYGFFHYRRYFSFAPSVTRDDGWGNIVYNSISDKAVDEIKLKPGHMREFITKYDVIIVKGRKYQQRDVQGNTLDVYHEYGQAKFHHKKDLDTALAVLKEKYPEFSLTADEYMKSSVAHECNMFIMKKKYFQEYSEWLFDILFEVEKRIDTTDYNMEENRVFGYLAERLCGIYYKHLKKNGSVKTYELPKTLFRDTTCGKRIAPVFKDAVPIVMSANDSFVPCLGVMLNSVIHFMNRKRNYDIIVLFTDVSAENQEKIKGMAKGHENISVRFVDVNHCFDKEKLFVSHHLSIETYYRLIIPRLMDSYHKILYLDCDMVVNCDVAELYDVDIGNCVIAAVKDIDVAGQVKSENEWEEYSREVLKLKNPYRYFQAGVLCIDLDKLREITSSKRLIKLAHSRNWRCHDQDILNVVCRNRVYYLPQKWNVLMNWQENERSRMQLMKMAPHALYEEYLEARKNPKIIHFAGYQKPWDTVGCDFSEYFWKFARTTPFYEVLLQKICVKDGYSLSSLIYKFKKKMKRLVDWVFPVGSKRRQWLKRMIWRLLENIR